MIIYNSNKEFVGIDEADLKSLGFKNLASLQAEAADFADLFVKTPGHVHNFKHVHWIDFVLCAKSVQESKAIIHANGKNFKVNLEIKTTYLTDAPSTQAFTVSLNNFGNLSADEKTEISNELQTRVSPIAAPIQTVVADEEPKTQEESIDIDLDELQTPSIDVVQDPYETQEDDIVDIYEPTQEELSEIGEAEVEEVEESIEIEMEEVEDSIELEDEVEDEDEIFAFDPKKTAEALEMPISLIEEFIEDFISQAKEFKDALYNAVAQDDMIELQAYSHKLKGVAANLRVNDALEILTKINKAKDFTTSKKDLDSFYKIISKLSGEKIQTTKTKVVKKPSVSIEDDDELLEIVDDDAPAVVIDNEELELNIDEDEDEMELVISDDFDILDDAITEIIQESDEKEQELQPQKFDKQSVALEIGITEEIFNELFDDYIDESQNLIDSIENAIANNIPEVWRESAIKLKGMSDNMRINSFKTDLKILITTTSTDDAKSALEKIQTTLFQILEKKD